MASEVISNLLSHEDDEIDLQFASMAKRMRKQLSSDDIEDCMDEMNAVVSRYLRVARARKNPAVPPPAIGANGDGPAAMAVPLYPNEEGQEIVYDNEQSFLNM